jgi:hypothetical protein
MYSSYFSQNLINHVARLHVNVSLTVISGWGGSRWGLRWPILVLKSPHMMVVSCGWSVSIMFSSWVVAYSSVMSLRFREDVGGIYVFTTFIL